MSIHQHGIGETGTEGGVCTTVRCQYSKIKPRADFWHIGDKRWVCMTCAQEENRRGINKSFGNYRPCISGREHLINTLKS